MSNPHPAGSLNVACYSYHEFYPPYLDSLGATVIVKRPEESNYKKNFLSPLSSRTSNIPILTVSNLTKTTDVSTANYESITFITAIKCNNDPPLRSFEEMSLQTTTRSPPALEILRNQQPRLFDDGSSTSGSDATFAAFSGIPSVDTSVSGGSANDWGVTPLSLPTLDEDYFTNNVHRTNGKMNSQIMKKWPQWGRKIRPVGLPFSNTSESQNNGVMLFWMGENDGGFQSSATSPMTGNFPDLSRNQLTSQSKKLRLIKPKIKDHNSTSLLPAQNPPPTPLVSAVTAPSPINKRSQQYHQIQVNSPKKNTGGMETLSIVPKNQAIAFNAPNNDLTISITLLLAQIAEKTVKSCFFPKRCIVPSPNLNPDGGSEHIAYPAFKRPREQIHAANEATLQYLFGVENWEDGRPHTAQASEVRHKSFRAFQNCFDRIMQDSVKFAKRIPGFSDLLPEDRMILVQSGCFEGLTTGISRALEHYGECWRTTDGISKSAEMREEASQPIGNQYLCSVALMMLNYQAVLL
ncbi:hypothetical protein ACTXT7_007334 [Hymenolepis weldensis]